MSSQLYHLVLWITADPPTTSILKSNEVKLGKNKVTAKWGSKWYEAKHLRSSTDDAATYNEMHGKNNEEQSESTFDIEEEAEIKEEIAEVEPSEMEVGAEAEAEANAEEGYTDDEDGVIGQDSDDDPLDRINLVSFQAEDGKRRLVKRFDIFIDSNELNYLKTQWQAKPREFVRRLMKLIIGQKELKRMTPTGRAGSKKIPKEIFKAVFKSHLLEAAKKFRNYDPDEPRGSCQPGKCEDDWKSVEFDEMKDAKENKIPKIYYGSRTHKQIEQVIREFRKTAYAHKYMTILSSREHTCIHSPEKGISKTQLCNNLLDPARKSGGCKYYKENNKQVMASNGALSCYNFHTPWDIEDLVELGKEKEACPYFAARALMAEADIIFCPYNYLIDPVIRETMKINLSGDVVIVDEAHNIESICRDVGSGDFREDHLGEAIEDCKLVFNLLQRSNSAYEMLQDYLTIMLGMIQEQRLPDAGNQYKEVTSACWTGDETWSLFKMHKLGGEAFMHFESACKVAIKDYNEVKEDISAPGYEEVECDESGKKKKKQKKPAITFITKKLIEELLSSLKNIQHSEYSKDYRCTILQTFNNDAKVKVEENKWVSGQGGRRLRTLKFMCMNPAIVFSQMARNTRCVILASGTLSPTSTFESELGTKFVHKLHANHVISKDQVYVRSISTGPKGTTLRATYKNVQTLPFKDDLGRLVLDVCQTVPHGVLCFFSSYSTMLSQLDRWKETEIWYELQQCKHVVQEPRSNNDLEEIMRDFRGVIRDTAHNRAACGINGALLFAVFRGKVAEGIDFSDNEARAVLTIGIPYAVQYDPVVKLKREYNDLHRNKGLLPGGEWYSVQAYRALNQALGRCIRHRNDWGAILLVDERLAWPDNINYLPKWIREMKRQGLHYDLKSELSQFVKAQKVRDDERANN